MPLSQLRCWLTRQTDNAARAAEGSFMRIGFVGMGNMAQAVAGGILKKGICAPGDIIASRRNQAELDKIKEKYSFTIFFVVRFFICTK